MSDGFTRFTWDGSSYNMHVSVDTLTADETTPSYVSYMNASEQMDYWEEQLEISTISLALYSRTEMSLEDDQLARVNGALQASTTKSIEIIPNNDIVPLPTPEVETVTPAPDDD